MRHKTALVSALSMVGVLMAGASALGANMGILDSADGIGEVTAVSNTVANSTTASTGATTTSTTVAADLAAYQINGVGVVTVAREGNKLFVESVDVGTWAYTVASQGKELSMEFDNGERTVSFKANVKDGEVLVEVWEDDIIVQSSGGSGTDGSTATSAPSATTSTTSPATTSTTYDDDSYDDDDEYEDDSYDDDEYEDEDEDDDHEDDDHYEDDDDDHEGGEDDD